jgi:hypothetical protein
MTNENISRIHSVLEANDTAMEALTSFLDSELKRCKKHETMMLERRIASEAKRQAYIESLKS